MLMAPIPLENGRKCVATLTNLGAMCILGSLPLRVERLLCRCAVFFRFIINQDKRVLLLFSPFLWTFLWNFIFIIFNKIIKVAAVVLAGRFSFRLLLRFTGHGF